MNREPSSFSPSPSKGNPHIKIDLDEFQISEETFKPMTKGLGFHQEVKRSTFKPTPKETPSPAMKRGLEAPLHKSLGGLSKQSPAHSSAHSPNGLEAFYGAKPVEHAVETPLLETKKEKLKASKKAPSLSQLLAWFIDVAMVASFVLLTGVLLVLASGIELKMYSRLISTRDLSIFGAAIFSIYYLLYFTILDLGASPGKTVMGIKLLRSDDSEVSVKNTFFRALISLLSGIALFLPMLLDFQGRLSDTKVVK